MRCGVPSLIGSTDPYMLRIGVEPHLVQCNSCQSRIRIRNPNLIGKRVACPKCKAEVLITPPAPPKIHVARADMPQVDSTALTKDGFGDEALGLLSSQNADGAVGGETPFSNFDFSDIDSALAQQSQANAAQATQAAYSSEVERQNPSSTGTMDRAGTSSAYRAVVESFDRAAQAIPDHRILGGVKLFDCGAKFYSLSALVSKRTDQNRRCKKSKNSSKSRTINKLI